MELKEEIKKFLDSEEKEFKFSQMYPIVDIAAILEEFGYEDMGDRDTNGWQIDFWQYFKGAELTLMLQGSLEYGDFKLSKEEE